MPRRWLSVRGQKESKDVVDVVEGQFDFEFVTNPQAPVSPSMLGRSKTNMFHGSPFRSRKSKNDLCGPQSSNGPKPTVDKRIQLTKVEDSWIGVAFGSPTHPPTSIPKFTNADNGVSVKHAYHNNGPLPSSTSSLAKCKKLGNLFRSRSGPLSISSPTNVYKIDGDRRIGMPVARKPLPDSRTLPDWLNAENPEICTASAVSPRTLLCTDDPLPCTKPLQCALPKLEILIPNAGLDRYSVMFSNVSGVKPSKLLERRSKNLGTTNTMPVEDTDVPPVPALDRSNLGPPATPTHRRKSSTYSLFPSPPKSRESVRSSPGNQLPRRQLSYSSRPSTAPGSSSSSLDKFNTNQVTQQRKESEMSFCSPDNTITSSERDDSPWRSTDSLHSLPSSRTSVGSEIFFDLKPAVDSDGRQQSQYFIHAPDLPAVELALSKSRSRRAKNKSQEENNVEGRISPDIQAAEHMLTAEERWRMSLELNQAIAEVERLTSPLSSILPPTSTSELEARLPEASPPELLSTLRFRKRFDGLAIGIPSPITEMSEEFSPRPFLREPLRMLPRQHIASLSIRPAPLNISEESIIPIEESLITPPPVPVKDAKYIPISKFIAKDSSVKLIEHHPKRRRPKRSFTDTSTTIKQVSSVKQAAGRERDRLATTANALDRTIKKSLPSANTKVTSPTANAVFLLPAAEVSIARTVSLQRKHSHRILLSSPKSRSAERMSGGLTLSPSRCLSPMVHGGTKAHQPGASLDLVVETTSH